MAAGRLERCILSLLLLFLHSLPSSYEVVFTYSRYIDRSIYLFAEAMGGGGPRDALKFGRKRFRFFGGKETPIFCGRRSDARLCPELI